jgi:hypothetical protein
MRMPEPVTFAPTSLASAAAGEVDVHPVTAVTRCLSIALRGHREPLARSRSARLGAAGGQGHGFASTYSERRGRAHPGTICLTRGRASRSRTPRPADPASRGPSVPADPASPGTQRPRGPSVPRTHRPRGKINFRSFHSPFISRMLHLDYISSWDSQPSLGVPRFWGGLPRPERFAFASGSCPSALGDLA